MRSIIQGNLFTNVEELVSSFAEDGQFLDIICHGCNAQGVMGSGFAKAIREKYPHAYDDYRKVYLKNNKLEIGTIIMSHQTPKLSVCNMITQKYYGRDGVKYISYDAIDDAFYCLSEWIEKFKGYSANAEIHVHYPKIGAGLGGGNWETIQSIIDCRLDNVCDHYLHLGE